MISVKNISKSYGKKGEFPALHDVNIDVAAGELFGLIGPDGAGKTSLFRILTTLILPTKGSATIGKFDVETEYVELRKRLGYMPGKFSLYQDLTVSENLEFYASIFETTIEKNYALIKDIYVQLEPFKDRRAGALSGGMKQKLALCCALIHKPEVLFLDEPTTGVDVVSRKEFWTMLKRLKKEGITIFVSTPYMDEASMCDRIALIQDGHILSVDTPGKVIESFPFPLVRVKFSHNNHVKNELSDLTTVIDLYSSGEYLHMKLNDLDKGLKDISSVLERNKIPFSNLETIKPTIEDCFLNLMSNPKPLQAVS